MAASSKNSYLFINGISISLNFEGHHLAYYYNSVILCNINAHFWKGAATNRYVINIRNCILSLIRNIYTSINILSLLRNF